MGQRYPHTIEKGLTPKKRRDLVLRYIRDHEASLVTQIVEGLAAKISKKPVHEIIDHLEEIGLIENISENLRDKRYVVSKNNEFIKLSNKMNLFSDKYFDLLRKIDDHQLLKQARESIERDKLGNIKIERDRDIIKSLFFAYHEGEKIFQEIYYLITRIHLYCNDVIELENRIQFHTTKELINGNSFSIMNIEYKEPVHYTLEDTRIETENQILFGYAKKRKDFAEIIERSIKQIKKLLPRYNTYSKRTMLLRAKMWSIYIFIVFLHYLNYESTMKWPFVISDKNRLSNMNELLYERILEINSRLSQYISLDESTSKLIVSLIKGERIQSFMNINDKRFYQMVADYQNIGIGKQVIKILELVMKDEENHPYTGNLSLDDFLKEKTKFCQNILK